MTIMTEIESAVSEYYGPSGFHWLIPGKLGGAPRPGLFRDLTADIEALARVGTRLLFTLTEEWVPDPTDFVAHGIDNHFVPIPDRAAPTAEQALGMCEIAEQYMARGEGVVYHCRAGKGRTGTMLAAQLIHAGIKAGDAITFVKHVNPKWIESDEQMVFLEALPPGLWHRQSP